jgi:hypothetical protein
MHMYHTHTHPYAIYAHSQVKRCGKVFFFLNLCFFFSLKNSHIIVMSKFSTHFPPILHPIFFSIEFEFNLNSMESNFYSIQGACNVIYI